MSQKNETIRTMPVHELPDHLRQTFRKATRLEWITVFYLISVIVVMLIAMQNSQAMKAAWVEDVLSIIPAISFLVARRYINREPSRRFPFAYHRVYSIAFLTGSFALFSLGLYVFYDSVSTLAKGDRPTIGTLSIAGAQIWFGWAMIAALLYSSVPAIFLGLKKLPLASRLHNKVLFTDAHTQRADWQTALAAILGIVLVGFGFWWADATAACIISVSIIVDGWQRLKSAVCDLMDETATDLENKKQHELVEKVHSFVAERYWVAGARVRMREAGEVFLTEVFIIPREHNHLVTRIAALKKEIAGIDWKLHDVVIMPVENFSERGDEG